MSDDDLPRNEFSVYVFLPFDWHMPLVRFTSIEDALRVARRASEATIGPASRAERIIITDGGDFTVFEWKRNAGVVFPPPETRATPDAASSSR
jgi:hypothetical protein